MIPLLIATHNPGKRVEIQALLAGLPFRLLIPAELKLEMEVTEDGVTYAENAALKARAFCAASGLLTLADDSGLEVAALDGLPGVHSARFSRRLISRSGAGVDSVDNTVISVRTDGGSLYRPGDAERRALLLSLLQDKPRPWTARFACTVAIAVPGEPPKMHFAEGECRGEIIPQERGEGGFGYDPIFLVAGLGRTMAELNMDEKNSLSHRARAILAARPTLAALAGDQG